MAMRQVVVQFLGSTITYVPHRLTCVRHRIVRCRAWWACTVHRVRRFPQGFISRRDVQLLHREVPATHNNLQRNRYSRTLCLHPIGNRSPWPSRLRVAKTAELEPRGGRLPPKLDPTSKPASSSAPNRLLQPDRKVEPRRHSAPSDSR